jgi:hypothetical protein
MDNMNVYKAPLISQFDIMTMSFRQKQSSHWMMNLNPKKEIQMELGNIKNLKRIGNTISKNNNGKGTDFICSGETARIEEMLLQHILESNGFRITDSYDFYWNDNVIDVCFETDIPFKDYMDIER